MTPALFARFPTPAGLPGVDAGGAGGADPPDRLLPQQDALDPRRPSAEIVERHGGEVPPHVDGWSRCTASAARRRRWCSSNAFGIAEGIAVDTHVRRVSRRLGLTDTPIRSRSSAALMRLYPRERWLEVSDVLIFHGRRVCAARRPRCEECAVADICPSSLV